ncbi:MAG TPA: hypothetical protein VF773_10730 [Verrucomicrobiae bacterium]
MSVLLKCTSLMALGFIAGNALRGPVEARYEAAAIPAATHGVAPALPYIQPQTLQSEKSGAPGGNSVITEEDITATMALSEREKGGEYILDLERSVDRKATRAAIEEMVFRTSSNNSPILRHTFAELGLPAEFAEQLETHRDKIMQASLQAELEIKQVQSARQEYEKRLRSVLSEEDYSKYLDFERRLPSSDEMEKIREFASNAGLALDYQAEETLTQLIGDAEAYTLVSWHGPFDGLPDPRTGDEAVTQQMHEQKESITATSNVLLQNTKRAGISSEVQDMLAAYYQEQVRERERVIEALKKSPSSTRPRTKLVRASEVVKH